MYPIVIININVCMFKGEMKHLGKIFLDKIIHKERNILIIKFSKELQACMVSLFLGHHFLDPLYALCQI